MAGNTLGGRYTVQDKIGTGGMAIVYRGLDEVLGRTVAIKVMLPQYANDQSFAARFKQEAQAAAALQSPYIVSVYDWGKDGDTYYIVMEYLRGTDLKSGIRKHGALDCRKVAQIGSQIAKALSVAHHHDIIHRDIKPQNIMVQPDGNIKVMDFGIARAKNSHLTTDNSVLGTAHYVSPEQTQGKELGATTDIYSLGIVMYEAATGRVPFDGDDAISVALKQVNEAPMPPSQINPHVDPALEGIILKCMQKRPENRFQSAAELADVLRDYLAGRLRDVTQKASAVNATEAAARRTNTDPQLRRTRDSYPVRSGTERGHYHTKSATAEEQNRRHRRNVIVGVVFTLVALMGVAIAAFAILSKPQTRSVPNLVGLTEDDARSQIELSEYFVLGTVKEEYDSTMAEGKVIDQDPDEGRPAREGTTIDLWVSKGPEPAKAVTVPDLKGKTPEEAEEELARMGLIGQKGDDIHSDVEAGKVADQTPAASTTAKAGDTVTYQLSSGPEEIEVPDVIGWSQSYATSTLQELGFTVVVNTEENDYYDAGVVSYQSVTGTASKGSEIVLTVSSGPSRVEIPSVAGQSEVDATNTLSSAGFNVAASYTSSDTVPAGCVVSQSATGYAQRGTTIEIAVSTGPSTPVEPATDDNPSGSESGSEGSGETGSENGGENGGESGGEGSGETGSENGGESGGENGGESGGETGETGETGGEAGGENGGESGGETGDDNGGETGETGATVGTETPSAEAPAGE